MKNAFYELSLFDNCNVDHLTLKDFIKACDILDLPVFEVSITIIPFAEPHRLVSSNKYFSMKEYRKTMPKWSAREYDFENDEVGAYIEYPEIMKGEFEVTASNNSSDFRWNFQVAGQCVVVHKLIQFTD